MSQPEQSSQEWFQDAVRSYDEMHQGCPWCGGAHRVYKSQRTHVVEYYCGSCEFFVCYDSQKARYFMGPGREHQAPTTMYAI